MIRGIGRIFKPRLIFERENCDETPETVTKIVPITVSYGNNAYIVFKAKGT